MCDSDHALSQIKNCGAHRASAYVTSPIKRVD